MTSERPSVSRVAARRRSQTPTHVALGAGVTLVAQAEVPVDPVLALTVARARRTRTFVDVCNS